MSNKDSYKRKHRYLDNQITKLEKTNSYNRELITNLKKKKLKLKHFLVLQKEDLNNVRTNFI